MSAAKEASTDVIAFIHADVAAAALALSGVRERVPGFLFVGATFSRSLPRRRKKKKWPMRFIEDDVAPVVRALSRVPGFSGLQFHLVDVLQVMSAAKEESIHVFPFIRAGVAPTATVLSRVPGLQFDLGDVLDGHVLGEGSICEGRICRIAKEEFAEFWRRSLAKENLQN